MAEAGVLERYRQRIAQETEGIRLPGMHSHPHRKFPYFPIQVLYTRVQALWFAPSTEVEAPISVDASISIEGEEELRGKRWTLDPALIDLLCTVRRYGAELYRRGQAYRALERPEPVMPDDVVQRYEHVVFLGVSGSGKTTLLRYLAHQTAGNPEGRMPVLLNARDYAAYVRSGGEETLYNFALKQATQGDAELFSVLRASESFLWLIDDLPYAASCRSTFLRQLIGLPGQIVATSSCAHYRHAGLEQFAPFEILSMTDEQIDSLLHDWLIWRSHLLQKGMDWVRERTQWVQTELIRRPAMQHVVRNPFALICALMLFGDEAIPDNFPERRSDLHARWLETVIFSGNISSQQQEVPDESLENWHSVLAHLAGMRCQSSFPDLPVLIEHLSNSMRSDTGNEITPDRQALEALLKAWLANGLLEFQSVGDTAYLVFAQNAIREYAMARHWTNLWRQDQQRAWQQIAPYRHHEEWRESVLMMGCMLDAVSRNALIQQILRIPGDYEQSTHHNLRLAISLIGENRHLVEFSEVEQIIRVIARLGKAHRNMRLIVLPTVYLAGILGLTGIGFLGDFAFSWLPLIAVFILWTLLWAAVLVSHEFPGFQKIVSLPLRFWSSLPERTLCARLLGHSGHVSAVPFLIEALRDDLPDIRRFAAEALGHIADIEAVPALLPLLRDAHGAVRRTAALALGEIGAIPRLVQAFTDSDGNVRHAAEEALERLSHSQAIPHLALMLQDPKEYVRQASVRTLRRIGGHHVLPPLVQALKDEQKEVRLIAAEALGELAEHEDIHSRLQARDGLLKALQDPERSVRWAAAYALGKLSDPTLAPDLMQALKTNSDYVKRAITDALRRVVKVPSILYLLQALHDENAEIRVVATEALQGICQHEDVHFRQQLIPEISQLLMDQDLQVRRNAAETLGLIGQTESVPLLINALNDPYWQVRWAAIEALGEIGDRQAVPYITPLLKDGHGYVGRAAAEALGKIGGNEAVPSLIQGLRSEKRYIQQAADAALRLIGPAHTVPFLLQALKHERDYVRQEAEAALRQVGQTEAVPYLIAALRDSDDDVRRAAVIALGQIGEVEAVPALISLLQDDQEMIRSVVAEALANIGHVDAIQALILALDDPSTKVRRMTARALGRLRAREAAEPLLAMLRDNNVNVRRVAVEALGRIASKESVPALLEALRDDAWWLRWSAAYALGRIGDHQVVPPLLQTLRDGNGTVRRAAAEALGQLHAEEAVQPLIEALMDEEWWVRWAAATALGQLNAPQALRALIPLLKDPRQNVRRAATEAIGKPGSGAAVPHLIQGLRDESWEVRQTAAKALRHISSPDMIPELLRAIKSGHAYVYKAASAALQNIEYDDAIPYLVEGIREDHELVREAAAEHLIRLGGIRALQLLLSALQHEHWRVRRMTAIVIGQLVDTIDDTVLLKRAARALWWRLTDKDEVAAAAFQALDMVGTRISVLGSADIPICTPSRTHCQDLG